MGNKYIIIFLLLIVIGTIGIFSYSLIKYEDDSSVILRDEVGTQEGIISEWIEGDNEISSYNLTKDEDDSSVILKDETGIQGENISGGTEKNNEVCINSYCFTPAKNANCESHNFKMAFILVESEENLSSPDDTEKIEKIKEKVSENFLWATNDLSQMDTSEPVFVIKMHDKPTAKEIASEFYKTHEDEFHFLSIYGTYNINPQGSPGIWHGSIQNLVEGIGLSIGSSEEYLASHGSEGMLLGIIYLNDINGYILEKDLDFDLVVNGVLSEIGHQWGVIVSHLPSSFDPVFYRAGGHWSKRANIGYALMGGSDWRDNGDGTFTLNEFPIGRQKYALITLYLMGLVDKQDVPPIEYIETSEFEMDITETIEGSLRQVSIDEIIANEGPRRCILEDIGNS